MDVDRIVGRVVCVSGSQVVIALEHDWPASGERPPRLHKGSIVKLPLGRSTVYGLVAGLSIPMPDAGQQDREIRLAELELLGEIPHAERHAAFRRGISIHPTLGDPAVLVQPDELGGIYRSTPEATLRIGTVFDNPGTSVFVAPDHLLGRHLAIVGTTGSGKSCAVIALLSSLLENHRQAHVLVLDPHNEYRRAFGDAAESLDADNLQLPYWLLTFEEMVSVILGDAERSKTTDAVVSLLGELIPAAKRAFSNDHALSRRVTVNTPLPYRLSDLDSLLDTAMGRLDKPDSLAPYRWLRARLASITGDSRYAFMFGGITVSDNMAPLLSRLFRIPTGGRPITTIDLSAVPPDIVNVVVSVLCRLAYDFAVWSRGAQPILLVCEEAHRYAPADPQFAFAPTTVALARIAREGRKYSLGLCMISQRPSELAPTVLSQCNTVFALRMTSRRDHESLRSILNDHAFGLLDILPTLGDAEAIVAGQAVKVPVRIRLPEVPEDRRPLGAATSFARAWQQEVPGEGFVQEVVDIWRRQQR
jgi:uncharacterized protein